MTTRTIQLSTLPRARLVSRKSRCFAYEEQIKEYRREIAVKVIKYIGSHRFPALMGAIFASTIQLASLFVATPVSAQVPIQPAPSYIKYIKPLPELHIAVPSFVSEITPPTPPPTQNAQNSPQSACAMGYFTGDYYLDKIINYESSGNSCATNYLGCFGLLQACPGEPLREACGGDPACQIPWFIDNKTGGRSWAQIWQHELDYGYW